MSLQRSAFNEVNDYEYIHTIFKLELFLILEHCLLQPLAVTRSGMKGGPKYLLK